MIEKQQEDQDLTLAEALGDIFAVVGIPVIIIGFIRWCVFVWHWFFVLVLLLAIGCGDDGRPEYDLCEPKTFECTAAEHVCVFDDTPEHAHCYGMCDPDVAVDGEIIRDDDGWIIPGQCPLWERCMRLWQSGLPTGVFACFPSDDDA